LKRFQVYSQGRFAVNREQEGLIVKKISKNRSKKNLLPKKQGARSASGGGEIDPGERFKGKSDLGRKKTPICVAGNSQGG